MGIIRPSTAIAELKELMEKERKVLKAAGFDRKNLSHILWRFDDYEKTAIKYLDRQVIIFKRDFKWLWDENWMHVYSGKLQHKRWNTAGMQIVEALREFGKRHNWI